MKKKRQTQCARHGHCWHSEHESYLPEPGGPIIEEVSPGMIRHRWPNVRCCFCGRVVEGQGIARRAFHPDDDEIASRLHGTAFRQTDD